MSDSEDDQTPVVVNLHVPKAGGTTLRHILLWEYGIYGSRARFSMGNDEDEFQAYRNLPLRAQREIRLLTGHMPFGVHEHVTRPCQYVTLLRDPVRRIVSLYYYIKSNWPPPQFTATLKEFVYDHHPSYTFNGQVRQIAGVSSEQRACSDEMLGVAKCNLEEHFSVAGLTERFDESLILMRHRLGWWKPPLYARANANRSRPSRSDLPSQLLETIHEQNALDVALYEHVRQRFEVRLEREVPALEREVQQLQTMNAIVGKVAPGPRWLLRKLRNVF